jgi:serine/threonine-protein kinase
VYPVVNKTELLECKVFSAYNEHQYNSGDQIGKYTIIRHIGTGGMAKVYEVINNEQNVKRALKIPFQDSSQNAINRFLLEADICSKLNNKNIVKVYSTSYHRNLPIVEMELVNGESVENKIREQKRLPILYSLSVMVMVLSALEKANSQSFVIKSKTYEKLIHRDIKPGNILISTLGEVKLTDFGLAKFDGVSMHTVKGLILGTTPYLAPELHFEYSATIQSDIYSIGVTLYEMICGARPFPEASIDDISLMIDAKKKKKFASLRKFRLNQPQVQLFIEKCLQPSPKKRFTSYTHCKNSLESIISSITHLSPETIIQLYTNKHLPNNTEYFQQVNFPKFLRYFIYTLLALITILSSTIFLMWKSDPTSKSHPPTKTEIPSNTTKMQTNP